ncbi:MAG: sensor histidine kinase [Kofleriaceae bacterium]
MKVATRITVATAVVVAIASATYAAFDLRARVAERGAAVEREARAVVSTLRVSLETVANDATRDVRYRADQLRREIEEVERKLVELGEPDPPDAIDATDATEPADDAATPPAPAGALPPAPPPTTESPEAKRLREKRERTELKRQRTELQARFAAIRGAAGLGRPLELGVAYKPPTASQLRDLGRASGNWRIVVLPRARAGEVPTVMPPTDDGVSPAQLRRLTTLIDSPRSLFTDVEDDNFFYAVALRAVGEREEDRAVLGMLEISTPASAFDTTVSDYSRALMLVILIVLVTTVMVGALASRFVSRPITKLLRGIDDVAKGDLSHVILSERDDEIGAIATRFNEMTYSLRESRTETSRENEAKLALEQRLGQTEKLATIGQLAAEIAHEVGTPLNVIAGRARSIQKKAKDPEAVEKNAEIVAEQTARITRIIQRLLDFTRRKVGSHERAAVNLNELAASTVELLTGQLSTAKVRTRVDKDSELPKIPGDADRLQQVLINLLLNAVQAMPDGGALHIDTRTVSRTRPGLETGADQRFVRVSVADTGIGIPDDIKDKIFDPFYTTKEVSGGTGLGLAVCSGIVKEHDGWIEVENGAAGGSVFRVYLPA